MPRLALQENGLHLVMKITTTGDVRLLHCAAVPLQDATVGDAEDQRWFRLVEVQCAGGNMQGVRGSKHTGSDPGYRLRYRTHSDIRNKLGRKLEITQAHEGLQVTSHLQFYDGLPVVRAWTELTNTGPAEIVVEYVSSFALTGVGKEGGAPSVDKLRVHLAHNTWHGEAQWRRRSLDDLGLRPVQCYSQSHSIKRCSVDNTGSWSSGGYLPMGAVENIEADLVWLWQIEHNGSWQWEVSSVANHFYLSLSGPTFAENHWCQRLGPGASFVSVPVAVACVAGSFPTAVAALTRYRRVDRQSDALPVIFNDYMNCLFGDPTSARLRPLIDAAAEVSCEVFCIDAGWYNDGGDWFAGKGLWEASRTRFPEGLPALLRRIRDRGMIPGLWLEPEVVSLDCPLAAQWPRECFFHRHGQRVCEFNHCLLDFRQPLVREHLDRRLNQIINDWGVGYLKLDDNINAGPGTEIGADSLGDGLLQHNRAYLDWLDNLRRRYPHVLVENCASGGMRLDGASLARCHIQSTSDQTDYRQTAVIAAGTPTAVLPEQCGVWSYPLAGADREAVVFNLVNAMLGRIQLSGQLARLDPAGRALVRAGIECYRRIRADIPRGLPAWPTGLPSFADSWLSYGLDCGATMYLAVWRRDSGREPHCAIPLDDFATVDLLYPEFGRADWSWDDRTHRLTVQLSQPPQARLFRLSRPVTDQPRRQG